MRLTGPAGPACGCPRPPEETLWTAPARPVHSPEFTAPALHIAFPPRLERRWIPCPAQTGCGTFFAYPRVIRHSLGNKSEGICFLPPFERPRKPRSFLMIVNARPRHPKGAHEKNGDAAEDIFPFFRRGSPFQPLLSSLTLDAYSGSETDPSEAFFGRRPRREDTGPSGNDPGSRPPSILNHGFFGVPWSKRCNMGAFR